MKSFIERIIREIKYKPGWELFVNDQGDNFIIYINMPIIATPPFVTPDESMKYVVFSTTVYANIHAHKLTRKHIIYKVFELIKECEIHEMKEWYVVNGIKVYDPHKHDSIHQYKDKNSDDTVKLFY